MVHHQKKKVGYKTKIGQLTRNTRKAMIFVDTADLIRACLVSSDFFYALTPNLKESIQYLKRNKPILEKLKENLEDFEFKTLIRHLEEHEENKTNKRFFSRKISQSESLQELNLFNKLISSLHHQNTHLIYTTQKKLNSINMLPLSSDIVETMFNELEEQYNQLYAKVIILETLAKSACDVLTHRENFTK